MLEKIVVGYAQDQAGSDAVALAGALARLGGGRLTVVFPYHPLLAKADAEDVQREVAAEVQALLGRHAPEPTLRWSSSPWPIHALHELAAYEEADLIVLGAAREDLGDRLHVSLMERMVHGAPCAVAVAPCGYAERSPGEDMPKLPGEEGVPKLPGEEDVPKLPGEDGALKRIGVGFADSPEGHEAVGLARRLAERAGGVVRIVAGAGLEPALASYAFSSPALGEVEEELYGQVEEQLERFCGEWPGDVPLERETVRGDPAGVLVERSAGLDLLVLGSRAYGPLRHALLGSVSARAMREARCPVLVVPRGVAADDEHDRERHAGAAHGG